MDNAFLLLLLVLAIAVMGGYYYLKRAQRRTHSDRLGEQPPTEHDTNT